MLGWAGKARQDEGEPALLTGLRYKNRLCFLTLRLTLRINFLFVIHIHVFMPIRVSSQLSTPDGR